MVVSQKIISDDFTDEAVINQPRTIIFSRIEPDKSVKLSEQKALHAIVYGFQNYVKRHYTSIAEYKRINGDDTSVVFSMSKRRFFYLAGLDTTRNTEYVKNTLNSLQDLKHTYDFSDILGRDKYGSVAFIYRWDIDGDRIEFTLPKESRMAMLQEEQRATFSLSQINNKLKGESKYSTFLYPALLSNRNSEMSGSQLIRLSDQEVRDALRIKYSIKGKGKKAYTIGPPSRVARQCIEPAVAGINGASLDYEILDTAFTKSACGEITWEFEIQPVISPHLAKFRNEYSVDIDLVEQKVKELSLREDSRKQILESIECEMSLGYVKYCFKQLEDRKAKGKMKKPGAYFWTIFTSNYDDFSTQWPTIQAAERTQKNYQKKAEKDRVISQLKEERLRVLQRHAESILASHPDVTDLEIAGRLKSFMNSQPGLSKIANRAYQKYDPSIAEIRARFIITHYGQYNDEFVENLLKSVKHTNIDRE